VGGGERRGFTLALETESRWVAAATVRVAEQEEDEKRSAEGRGVWMAAEGFAMAVRCGANWARGDCDQGGEERGYSWRARGDRGLATRLVGT
jgi:hypothetical protein